MSKNNFWAFLKWYFKYTNKEFFDNSNSNTPSYVGNKERLPFIIISYFIFISSFVILFIHINGIYWFSIFGFIISIGFLFLCRFSIIYYLFIFFKFVRKNNSFNKKIIFEECILHKLNKKLRRSISNYYKIVDSKGNALVFKIYLQERNKETNNKKEKILKIKSNKIIFDGKIIFGEIFDENQLLELLDKERTITLK